MERYLTSCYSYLQTAVGWSDKSSFWQPEPKQEAIRIMHPTLFSHFLVQRRDRERGMLINDSVNSEATTNVITKEHGDSGYCPQKGVCFDVVTISMWKLLIQYYLQKPRDIKSLTTGRPQACEVCGCSNRKKAWLFFWKLQTHIDTSTWWRPSCRRDSPSIWVRGTILRHFVLELHTCWNTWRKQ
jgi:hypothetical protein